MKTKILETTFEVFATFALSNDEMISVRGGDDGEPVPSPPLPPIKI
jgi:hypothetical protein